MFDVQKHSGARKTLYYVTALSNFARGFDKFSRRYDKARTPESTYRDKFFLLEEHELTIGLNKAAHLSRNSDSPGDGLIELQTSVDPSELLPNLQTGLGRCVERGHNIGTGYSVRIEADRLYSRHMST